MHDHVGTRARGKNDRTLCRIKDVKGMGGHFPGVVAQSDVEGRLATAGLIHRELDRLSDSLEQINRCFADFREEGINKTGNEQLHSHLEPR